MHHSIETLRYFFLFISLFFWGGCGVTKDEKTAEVVLSANILLTQGKCQEAIEVLEGHGRVNEDAKYLMTLASAYACLNGYRETSFFANDLSKTNTPTPFGGAGTYQNAGNMTSATDSDFYYMQKAIDILIYAGGLEADVNPTADLRALKFIDSDARDINSQLLYMVLEQLGRFYRYYGNSSSTGVKGSGTGANTCFVSYENVSLDVGTNLTTYLALGTTGACTAIATGHGSFGVANNYVTSRLCQGVVLMNTLLDLLPKVLSSSTSTDLSAVSGLQTNINLLKTALATAKVGTTNVKSVTSQTLCVSQNSSNDDFIQAYYAFIFEPLFL